MANCSEVACGILIKEILALTHMQISEKNRKKLTEGFEKVSVKMGLSMRRNTSMTYLGDRLGALNQITSAWHLHGTNVTNLVFDFCSCILYENNGQ